MSHKDHYLTPEQFISALSDALHDTYYRDGEWTTPHHPEDLAMNTASIAEAIGGFMSSIIRNDIHRSHKRQEGLDRLLETIRSMRDEIDTSQLNDAYVEEEE